MAGERKKKLDRQTDETCEAALLSNVLFQADILDDPNFSPGLFGKEDYKDLAECLIACRTAGLPINADSVRLESKSEELADLAEKLASRRLPGKPEKLMERLIEVGIRYVIAQLASHFHSRAYDEAEDINTIVEDLESEALKIRPSKSSTVVQGGDMRGVFEDIKWRAMHPMAIRGRETGFPRLDRMLDGFQNGSLYVIAARPSCGKTALLVNMLEHEITVNKGVPFVVSAEMGANSIRKRALAKVARTPTNITGRAMTKMEGEALMEGIKKMRSWNWHIDETPRCTIRHIRSTARRLKRDHNITSIWIDYLQLIRGVRKGSESDRRAEVSEVIGECKEMARELGVPVVVLCQLRRPADVYDTTEKRTKQQAPELHHLKESGDIEQDADGVILIDRDQRTASPDAILDLAKNREGETGKVAVEFLAELTLFREKP